MSLKYTCQSCGTPLGYEGLCWKCKCEQERENCSGLDTRTNCREAEKLDSEHPAAWRYGGPGIYRLLAAAQLP